MILSRAEIEAVVKRGVRQALIEAFTVNEGSLVEIENVATLADGLAGQIDDEAFDIGRHGLDAIATVTEAEIADTIAWLWRTHGQRVEGAGACATAAVRTQKLDAIATPAVIVVSGGNIDATRHEEILSTRA